MLPSRRADPLIVRCASCQTEFALDDRQVGPDGAAVRCSVCTEVFRVEPPDGVVAQPWQVRTIDDLLFTAPDLATLHSWILEGRLHPDDRVSRSGRNFVRLGEMPEFAEAFSGFVGLPGVLETEAERGRSEQSALDVLGPPPAFGTHAGDDADAALAGVPESANLEHSAMLTRVVEDSGGATGALEGTDAAVVPRAREFGGSMPAAEAPVPPRPPPPPPTSRHPTPVPGARPPTRPPTLPPVSREAARGVPAAIHDERGSSRPMSMLDVVTQHVRPIAAPVVEAGRPADSAPIVAGPQVAREVVPPVAVVTGPADAVAARRGGGWMVWAALGILAGGAVVFGIPQIRNRVLGTPPAPAPVVRDDARVLEDAAAALASADPQQLARADAALVVAIDGGGDRARLGITLAEVLATRAVVHELWAAVEPAMRSDARFWAQEDAGRAAALLDGLDGSDPATSASFARAHALLRIVQGRADAAGLAVDEEGALLVAVAPLLRDPAAKLPDAVRTGLVGLPRPSVLARLVLALGHARASDPAAARAVTDAVLATTPGQPVARAIGRALAGGSPADKPVGETPGDEPVVVADGGGTPPVEPVPTPPTDPAESPDRLIDRGCKKAESGDPAGALPLLRKALDKRPNDLDALLCTGDANSRLGAYDVALKHYEKALGRSPQMMSALAGAGKAAAKLGRTAKAVKFYERLLEQDPSHDQARAYVDAHKGSGGDDGTDNG